MHLLDIDRPAAPPAPAPGEPIRVELGDGASAAFWSCLLDAPPERIAQAVARVGGDLHAVDAWLRSDRRREGRTAHAADR